MGAVGGAQSSPPPLPERMSAVHFSKSLTVEAKGGFFVIEPFFFLIPTEEQ